MGQKGLCSKFGVPPATLCRVLGEAELAMNRAIAGFSPARIMWPSLAWQRALSRLTADRHPLLPFTWGFIDGKNLKVRAEDLSGGHYVDVHVLTNGCLCLSSDAQVQEPSDRDLQNAHYNGWLHAVVVTGTLCFSADGLIIWSKHNYPGSWNDADTSPDFRAKLVDSTINPDARYGAIADSAFQCGDDMRGRIMTPLKEGDLARLVPSVRAVAHRKSKAIMFIRQAIEWGMGSVEKVFHRLGLPLPYDVQKRRARLDNLFRLANYRVRIMEIRETRTTFVYDRVDND